MNTSWNEDCCEKCETINTITLENGDLKKRIVCVFWLDFTKIMQIGNILYTSLRFQYQR
jgi:hypothetical protein